MSKVPVSDFVDYVMTSVPGCPRELVLREIIESIIEFCEYSTIWRVEMYALSVIEGLNTYEIDLPTDTRLAKLISIRANGKPVVAKTSEWMDDNVPNWRTRQGDTFNYYAMIDHETIILDRVPKYTQIFALRGTLALKPHRAVTEVPTVLYEDWLRQISAGAKSKLLAIPKKGWTDLNQAGICLGDFERGKAKGRREAEKGNSTADLRVSRRRITSK